MYVFLSLLAVVLLIAVVLLGVGVVQLHYVFGIIIPYAAIATFLIGVVYRVLLWAKVPVPFRIPTSCGQQKTHRWIKSSYLDNPHSGFSTIARMALEVLAFRSLFRNTVADLKDGPRIVYGSTKWLWAAALAFHYSFLVILIRHINYFVEPTPEFIKIVQSLDGFFQVGLPVIYITDGVLLGAVGFLLLRRLADSRVRYISLIADYFPLLLDFRIAVTGILMRYFYKVDLVAVKQLATGLFSLSPVVPDGIGVMFYIHLFMICTLFAYFPFSKLMHAPGIFLSPTRNMANNNRMKRHINPWNPKVKFHTYDEYEDDFRDVMKAADMPVEKE